MHATQDDDSSLWNDKSLEQDTDWLEMAHLNFTANECYWHTRNAPHMSALYRRRSHLGGPSFRGSWVLCVCQYDNPTKNWEIGISSRQTSIIA